MPIQFSRDIKIFVTDNVDSNGFILTTGINSINTNELLIQKDTLDFTQSVTNTFTNDSNLLDDFTFLDNFVNTDTDVGKCNFTTLLNSGVGVLPNDARLWNNLVNQSNLSSSSKWTLGSGVNTLQLLRDHYNPNCFGIIIILNNLAYLLHNCRISALNVNIQVNSLITNQWSIDYLKQEVIPISYTISNSLYTFTAGLTGVVPKVSDTQYQVTAGNFAKVKISDIGIATPFITIPSLGTTINFSNSLTYVTNNLIDKQNTNSTFASADGYKIAGNLSVYTRISGNEITTLLDSIRSQQTLASGQLLHRITIEIPIANTNIIEIILDGCLLVTNVKADTVITSLVDFTIVNSTASTNCCIKFYS